MSFFLIFNSILFESIAIKSRIDFKIVNFKLIFTEPLYWKTKKKWAAMELELCLVWYSLLFHNFRITSNSEFKYDKNEEHR